MPDKSGLPSDVRGAGAVRFGFPSAVRGIPGVGKLNHWAHRGTASMHAAATIAILSMAILSMAILSMAILPMPILPMKTTSRSAGCRQAGFSANATALFGSELLHNAQCFLHVLIGRNFVVRRRQRGDDLVVFADHERHAFDEIMVDLDAAHILRAGF